jgi:hypothetical protein
MKRLLRLPPYMKSFEPSCSVYTLLVLTISLLVYLQPTDQVVETLSALYPSLPYDICYLSCLCLYQAFPEKSRNKQRHSADRVEPALGHPDWCFEIFVTWSTVTRTVLHPSGLRRPSTTSINTAHYGQGRTGRDLRAPSKILGVSAIAGQRDCR